MRSALDNPVHNWLSPAGERCQKTQRSAREYRFVSKVYILRAWVCMNTQTNQPTRNIRTSMSIGQELRTVGQGLESLNVEDFDLRSEADGYFALAVPRVQSGGLAMQSVRSAWWSLARRGSTDQLLSEAGPNVLRVLFTPEGILRLEAAGIAKRNTHLSGAPDLTKLAPILRMIGER